MRKIRDNYNPENVYRDDFTGMIHKMAYERYKDEHRTSEWVDIETEYKKQQQFLEELEIERYIKAHKLNGVYRTRTTKAGNQLEVDIYPSFYIQADVPKEQKGTSPAQKKLNRKNSQRKFIALMNENFGEDDYWCTWSYTDENLPTTEEEAGRNMVNFVRRINYQIKKRGLFEFKFMYTIEWDSDIDKKTGKEKIRCHHHMVCNSVLDRDTLENLWKKGKRNQTRRISPDIDSDLIGMATYMSKDPKGKKSWKSSKNLKKPKVTKSYSKFNKKEVNKMVRNENEIKTLMEKKYSGYKFIDAKVYYNKKNQGNYIYARMVRC